MPATSYARQDALAQSRGDAVRRDTPSGYPVPRFVSLKAAQTYCRAGPSFEHPIRVTFLKKGLPVIVVAETRDHWRKIQDRDGDMCWVHKSKLSGTATALVIVDGAALHTKPDSDAPIAARLGSGLVAEIERERGEWRRITVNGARGWAPVSALWGADRHRFQ